MLAVQKYLQENSLESLCANFGINAVKHESLPLVILNYDQIISSQHKELKFHPIVKECRGLTLELETWKLVARSFPRFFNLGEDPEGQANFDWQSGLVLEKLDGSLIVIYNYNGKWMANTRGSFGTGKVNDSPYSWHDLIKLGLGVSDLSELDRWFDPELTYVCELVSPYNKIVTYYPKTQLILLSVFKGEEELYPYAVKQYLLSIVNDYPIDNISGEKLVSELNERGVHDPTFEGFVVRDKFNNRIKVKSVAYLGLHRIRGNGNVVSPKNIIRVIMDGNGEEYAAYFPSIQWMLDLLDKSKDELIKLWNSYKDCSEQKAFALGVKNHPLASIAFNARKRRVSIEEEWQQSESILLKFLERNEPK